MKEIEVKILDINVGEVRKKLQNLKAEKIFDGEIKMVCFDYPTEDLKKEGKTLRVRKVGEQVELCFKGKKENSKLKVREEIETTTESFEDTVTIFDKLGFKRFYEGTKKRESYKLKNARFEIDTFPDIPTFVEIEAQTEKEVQEAVESLGYTMEQTTNKSAREIKKQYGK